MECKNLAFCTSRKNTLNTLRIQFLKRLYEFNQRFVSSDSSVVDGGHDGDQLMQNNPHQGENNSRKLKLPPRVSYVSHLDTYQP
jgi:hypothetical protein